jgi:parallel beta-helix repeat protein
MDYREHRTPTELPKPPLTRRERARKAAGRFFNAGLGLLLLILLYLGFFPVPADNPTGSSEELHAHQAECERKLGTRSLTPATHTVQPGRSIQIVLDQAQPGDTVLVHYDVYGESLRLETDALTLRGLPEAGQRPVLEGMGRLENGIVACADGITIEGMELRNFTANGVLMQDVDRGTIRDVFANHTGEYGLFVLRSQRVSVENSAASGASDTGIYIGQSRDVVVSGNEAFDNVSGFEVENSSGVLVQDNHAHDNTAGILVFLLPDLEVKQASGNTVRDNRVVDNNLENFAPEEEIVSNVPAGTGILIMAADRTEVTGNEIRGNRSVGVAVIGLRQLLPDRVTFDVGTEPERNWIHGNTYTGNGGAPDPALSAAGLPGADLLWDASGWDNLWSEPSATRFPQILPGPQLPAFVRRGLWRVLVILRDLS